MPVDRNKIKKTIELVVAFAGSYLNSCSENLKYVSGSEEQFNVFMETTYGCTFETIARNGTSTAHDIAIKPNIPKEEVIKNIKSHAESYEQIIEDCNQILQLIENNAEESELGFQIFCLLAQFKSLEQFCEKERDTFLSKHMNSLDNNSVFKTLKNIIADNKKDIRDFISKVLLDRVTREEQNILFLADTAFKSKLLDSPYTEILREGIVGIYSFISNPERLLKEIEKKLGELHSKITKNLRDAKDYIEKEEEALSNDQIKSINEITEEFNDKFWLPYESLEKEFEELVNAIQKFKEQHNRIAEIVITQEHKEKLALKAGYKTGTMTIKETVMLEQIKHYNEAVKAFGLLSKMQKIVESDTQHLTTTTTTTATATATTAAVTPKPKTYVMESLRQALIEEKISQGNRLASAAKAVRKATEAEQRAQEGALPNETEQTVVEHAPTLLELSAEAYETLSRLTNPDRRSEHKTHHFTTAELIKLATECQAEIRDQNNVFVIKFLEHQEGEASELEINKAEGVKLKVKKHTIGFHNQHGRDRSNNSVLPAIVASFADTLQAANITIATCKLKDKSAASRPRFN